MKSYIRVIVAVLLLGVVLFTCGRYGADEDEQGRHEAYLRELVSDEDSLDAIVRNYLKQRGINSERIAIGYHNFITGETYQLNPDTAFFSGSLYKVPLVMLYSDALGRGTLHMNQLLTYSDTAYEEGGPVGEIYVPGDRIPLKQLLYDTIVYSDNTAARILFQALGGWDTFRTQIQGYSLNDMDEHFYENTFTISYTQDVLLHLYEHQDAYALLLDDMKVANPNAYLKQKVDITIAQKYGSYDLYEHAIGIVYGDHPYSISIFTELGVSGMDVIGDLNLICYTYANK